MSIRYACWFLKQLGPIQPSLMIDDELQLKNDLGMHSSILEMELAWIAQREACSVLLWHIWGASAVLYGSIFLMV